MNHFVFLTEFELPHERMSSVLPRLPHKSIFCTFQKKHSVLSDRVNFPANTDVFVFHSANLVVSFYVIYIKLFRLSEEVRIRTKNKVFPFRGDTMGAEVVAFVPVVVGVRVHIFRDLRQLGVYHYRDLYGRHAKKQQQLHLL